MRRTHTNAANVNGEPGFFAPYEGTPSFPDSTGGTVSEIDLVLTDQISLSDWITKVALDYQCIEYPPVV